MVLEAHYLKLTVNIHFLTTYSINDMHSIPIFLDANTTAIQEYTKLLNQIMSPSMEIVSGKMLNEYPTITLVVQYLQKSKVSSTSPSQICIIHPSLL